MGYSIAQVAEKTHLTAHTYYSGQVDPNFA